MNGNQQEGLGWMGITIHKGRRWSAAQAYLWPAMKSPNQNGITITMTTKFEFLGRRVTGINVNAIEGITRPNSDPIRKEVEFGDVNIRRFSLVRQLTHLNSY